MYDYEGIGSLAAELGRPIHTLLALTPQVDPFYAGVPSNRKQAEWFAEIWRRGRFTTGVHIRRIHYWCVSQDPKLTFWDGEPYKNNDACQAKLISAGRAARYLRLVPPGAFEDHKSPEPVLSDTVKDEDAELVLADDEELEIPELSTRLPDLPRLELVGPTIRQRYMVEVWCEKSTINDVLMPLKDLYGISIVVGTGDMSVTRCHEVVDRVIRDGRPCRILYVSDFDPKGVKMPLGVARKIEYRLRSENLDLDIQVHPIALTKEQCDEYQLPRTETKPGDRCAAEFEKRFGAGQTELDAMEALHPGELGRIMRAEIERFYDDDLAGSIEESEEEIANLNASATDAVHEEFSEEISAMRTEYSELTNRINEELRAFRERYESTSERIRGRLREAAPYIDDYEWPEPADGDEYDDPLFDSSRDYVEQIDRYKAHEDKPIDSGPKRPRAPVKSAAARNAEIKPIVDEIRQAANGETNYSHIARELNSRGVKTPSGGEWHATQVRRLLLKQAA